MDESVETHAQLRQHRVHILPIHGLPHVLHLPTDIGADFGAGLRSGRDGGGGGVQGGENVKKRHDVRTGRIDVRFPFLTAVYWIMTLFSSSGLKSVFLCSVAKMCFICPTMQFSVLSGQKRIIQLNTRVAQNYDGELGPC